MAGRTGGDAGARSARAVPNVRGESTRRRIAEATLTLFEECETPPTAHDIAERAGVSRRLIFHHFDDLDALHLSVSALYPERYGKYVPTVPADLPLETRIERTAKVRARLYEAIGNLGRNASALAPNHPGIAAGVDATQRLMISFLEETFTPELDATSASGRKELLAAIDAAVCWHLWDRLRRTSGLSASSARRVMVRMLRAAFDDTT